MINQQVTEQQDVPGPVARLVSPRPPRDGVTPREIAKAQDLAARCMPFKRLRKTPSWGQHDVRRLHLELFGESLDAGGNRRKVPSSGLRLFAHVRAAVRCGFPGIRASFPELGEILDVHARTVQRNVNMLEELGLLVRVKQYTTLPTDQVRKTRNCYVLGPKAPPVHPPRKRKRKGRAAKPEQREERAGQPQSIAALVERFGGAVTTADELDVARHGVAGDQRQNAGGNQRQNAATTPPTSWGVRARAAGAGAHAREAQPAASRDGVPPGQVRGDGVAAQHATPASPPKPSRVARAPGASEADKQGAGEFAAFAERYDAHLRPETPQERRNG